ncbi:MAG TPA: trypsin-like peptidase domain-containing protein [Actinoplanes sp.]|nr:trypsin-like peptidase domain-containing protein [Actinoplanes sp.]
MRRKAGIVLGACAAVVLAGSAGALVARTSENPTGTWTEASVTAPRTPDSPVAEPTEKATVPVIPVPETTTVTPDTAVTSTTKANPSRRTAKKGEVGSRTSTVAPRRPLESATTPPGGRQRIGSLKRVDELLGYQSGPKRQKFAYPGSSYVKVHFERLDMLPGDFVTVSNPAGTESYRYESDADGRWAMSISGDTAIVEVHRQDGSTGDTLSSLGVDIDKVARGDTRTEATRARPGREESVCGTDTSADAVCYESKDPVAYTKSKAIARLLINGTELCTGWRVGAKNRMITNNHCLTNSTEAYDTEVWFNYQCAKCGGSDVFKPTKVWGDKVLATDKTYDYTLFSVDGFEKVQKFGYLTLDTARPKKGQELYVPQHPAGEPAKIAGSKGEAAGNCAVDNPDYTGYAAHSDVSYYCDTAGGSSGSPVISRATNRVVALHHFGGCPNSGVRGDLLAGKLRAYL